jgi:hypothetical protein
MDSKYDIKTEELQVNIFLKPDDLEDDFNAN